MRGKIFIITPEVFATLLRDGTRWTFHNTMRTIDGIPEGAKFIRSWVKPSEDTVVYALFEHESFDDEPEGCSFRSVRVQLAKGLWGDCPVCDEDLTEFLGKPPYFEAEGGGVSHNGPNGPDEHWAEGWQTCPECQARWFTSIS